MKNEDDAYEIIDVRMKLSEGGRCMLRALYRCELHQIRSFPT
jgi:hypothetical protein